jgi:hypothetical protein
MPGRVRVIVCLLIATGCSGGGSFSPVVPGAPLQWQLWGVVRCNGGDPVAGAMLEITDGPNAGRRATTDASGQYLFPALEQATFSVRASAADHESVTQAVALTGNAVLDFDLPEENSGER